MFLSSAITIMLLLAYLINQLHTMNTGLWRYQHETFVYENAAAHMALANMRPIAATLRNRDTFTARFLSRGHGVAAPKEASQRGEPFAKPRSGGRAATEESVSLYGIARRLGLHLERAPQQVEGRDRGAATPFLAGDTSAATICAELRVKHGVLVGSPSMFSRL